MTRFLCGKRETETYNNILLHHFHAVTLNVDKLYLPFISIICDVYYGLMVLVLIYIVGVHVYRNGKEGRSTKPKSKTVGHKVCRPKLHFIKMLTIQIQLNEGM